MEQSNTKPTKVEVKRGSSSNDYKKGNSKSYGDVTVDEYLLQLAELEKPQPSLKSVLTTTVILVLLNIAAGLVMHFVVQHFEDTHKERGKITETLNAVEGTRHRKFAVMTDHYDCSFAAFQVWMQENSNKQLLWAYYTAALCINLDHGYGFSGGAYSAMIFPKKNDSSPDSDIIMLYRGESDSHQMTNRKELGGKPMDNDIDSYRFYKDDSWRMKWSSYRKGESKWETTGELLRRKHHEQNRKPSHTLNGTVFKVHLRSNWHGKEWEVYTTDGETLGPMAAMTAKAVIGFIEEETMLKGDFTTYVKRQQFINNAVRAAWHLMANNVDITTKFTDEVEQTMRSGVEKEFERVKVRVPKKRTVGIGSIDDRENTDSSVYITSDIIKFPNKAYNNMAPMLMHSDGLPVFVFWASGRNHIFEVTVYHIVELFYSVRPKEEIITTWDRAFYSIENNCIIGRDEETVKLARDDSFLELKPKCKPSQEYFDQKTDTVVNVMEHQIGDVWDDDVIQSFSFGSKDQNFAVGA